MDISAPALKMTHPLAVRGTRDSADLMGLRHKISARIQAGTRIITSIAIPDMMAHPDGYFVCYPDHSAANACDAM
ncbi:hypothetical protein GCM10008927_18800 [Amylibacter ulvae]|uniref:Uncharacterized protein n=1 Tax=Paramylibacter ulvae TaxID=1651968 RepID=A0ABQ3D6J9_9RHOB|nr:hypothetical protein GCM10008927_18800 [Amylibacter ulvae]